MLLREERMSDQFVKYHIDGLPFAAVLHKFSEPDSGDPHDHPWPFRSFILHGGYVERVYNLDGSFDETTRQPGDSIIVPADRIHRIIDLPHGECWTLVQPLGPAERVSGFYRFREYGTYHRFWHESEWKRAAP